MADEILFFANLDHTQVLQALEEIGQTTAAMAQNSDKSIQKIASSTAALATEYRNREVDLNNLIGAMYEAGEGETTFYKTLLQQQKDLRASISKTASKTAAIYDKHQKLQAGMEGVALYQAPGIEGPSEPIETRELVMATDTAEAEAAMRRFFATVEELMARGETDAQVYAAAYSALGDHLEDVLRGEDLEAASTELRKGMENVLTGFELGDKDFLEQLGLENAEEKMKAIDKLGQSFLEEPTERAREFGRVIISDVENAWGVFEESRDLSTLKSSLGEITSKIKLFNQETLEGWEKINKGLRLNTAMAELDQLEEQVRTFLRSGQEEATQYGLKWIRSVHAIRKEYDEVNPSVAELNKSVGLLGSEIRTDIRGSKELKEVLESIEPDFLKNVAKLDMRAAMDQVRELNTIIQQFSPEPVEWDFTSDPADIEDMIERLTDEIQGQLIDGVLIDDVEAREMAEEIVGAFDGLARAVEPLKIVSPEQIELARELQVNLGKALKEFEASGYQLDIIQKHLRPINALVDDYNKKVREGAEALRDRFRSSTMQTEMGLYEDILARMQQAEEAENRRMADLGADRVIFPSDFVDELEDSLERVGQQLVATNGDMSQMAQIWNAFKKDFALKVDTTDFQGFKEFVDPAALNDLTAIENAYRDIGEARKFANEILLLTDEKDEQVYKDEAEWIFKIIDRMQDASSKGFAEGFNTDIGALKSGLTELNKYVSGVKQRLQSDKGALAEWLAVEDAQRNLNALEAQVLKMFEEFSDIDPQTGELVYKISMDEEGQKEVADKIKHLVIAIGEARKKFDQAGGFSGPGIGGSTQFVKDVSAIENTLKNQLKHSTNLKAVWDEIVAPELEFGPIELNVEEAERKLKEFGQLMEDLVLSPKSSEQTKEFASEMIDHINNAVEEYERSKDTTDDQADSLKVLNDWYRTLVGMAKDYNKELDKSGTAIQDKLDLSAANSQMENLTKVAEHFKKSGDEAVVAYGEKLLSNIKEAHDGYIATDKDVKVLVGNMSKVNKEMKATVSTSEVLQEELQAMGKMPVEYTVELDIERVKIEIKKLDRVLRAMAEGTEEETRRMGEAFGVMEAKIVAAWKAGEIPSKEAIARLKELRTLSNDTGKELEEDWNILAGRAKEAIVPIWKLGTAMDRLGIRGGGGILRVVDAIKQLPPAAILTIAAFAGLVAITIKLIGQLIELGKQAAKAFYEFTKGAVDAAVQMQHLDRQFGGMLKGTESLGKVLREYLLDQSFEFGVDLTGDFANILVPLAKNTDQIRQMAEDVAAIAHFRGIAVENIVNAVKQATGGHFRPFQQTLGMTPQEVDRVQELQEAYGQLTGTIMGLEEFMERRGINFDALGDSLAVAKGQFVVFRKEMEVALGEPVRDALGEQFTNFLEFIEENRPKILGFLETLGDMVGDVLGYGGDLLGDWLGSIDQNDIDDLEEAISDIRDASKDFIDTIRSITDSDFDVLKTGFLAVLGIVEDIVKGADAIAEFLGKAAGADEAVYERLEKTREEIIFESPRPPDREQTYADWLAGRDPQEDLKEWERIQREGPDATGGLRIPEWLKNLFSSEYENEEEWREAAEAGEASGLFGWLHNFLLEGQENAGDAGRAIGEAWTGGINEALEESRFIGWEPPITQEELNKRLLEEANWQMEFEVNETRKADLEKQIEELEEKIKPAKIGMEFDQKAAKILVDEEDKRLQKEIDFSIKRRDATIKYLNEQRDARIKYGVDEAEIREDAGEKIDDLMQKFRDKEEDREEDKAKKRIKLEEKLQEKLRDIKAKFDFDAAEAIRMNDAVALLRIRRRMAFELAQAKLKHKDDIEENDDVAEEKRKDNKKWLDRQVRDANEAEKRKLLDLLQVYEQKKDDMDQQYNDELHMLALHEQDKEDAIAEWRRQADRDLQTWHDNKMAMNADRFKDEITQLRAHEREKREILLKNMHLVNRVYYDPVAWGQSSTNLYSPSSEENYGGYIPNTQVSSPGTRPPQPPQPPQQQTPLPNVPGATPPPISTVPEQIVEQARKEAIRLALKGGFPDLAKNLELMTHYQSIKMNLEWLRSQGLFSGGIAPAGRTSLVGEKGPEPIMPISAGIVAPHVPLDYSPGNTVNGGIVNDNSQNVNADLSMIKPDELSPMQRTIVRSIITDEILSLGVG